MSRKLDLTARQVTAICKGAAKAGYVAKVAIGETVVWLVPEDQAVRGKEPGEEELDRQLEAFERHVPWPGPHLNHREDRVLQILVEADGLAMAADAIPLAGPRTVNGLIAYGLVGLEDGVKSFDRSQKIHATKEGLSFFRRRKAHYRQYPSL
ncbi:MAG: hypothetical protein EPN45_00635 [Rhizobiaceae bacterium]|nr:MAG: hypothetical protein EPN45_00635 [Rhizobiaceae bacterium]